MSESETLEVLRAMILQNLLQHAIISFNPDYAVDEKTQELWGDDEQLKLMQDIRTTLHLEMYKDAPVALDLLDARVAEVARGPLLFNVILTMYRSWSQRWREENPPVEDMEFPADEDMDSEPESGVAPSKAKILTRGGGVGALLQKLRMCSKTI
jgi:hypothetical protein